MVCIYTYIIHINTKNNRDYDDHDDDCDDKLIATNTEKQHEDPKFISVVFHTHDNDSHACDDGGGDDDDGDDDDDDFDDDHRCR